MKALKDRLLNQTPVERNISDVVPSLKLRKEYSDKLYDWSKEIHSLLSSSISRTLAIPNITAMGSTLENDLIELDRFSYSEAEEGEQAKAVYENTTVMWTFFLESQAILWLERNTEEEDDHKLKKDEEDNKLETDVKAPRHKNVIRRENRETELGVIDLYHPRSRGDRQAWQ